MFLNEFKQVLEKTPVILLSDPLSLAFIDDVCIIKNQREYFLRMDSLEKQESNKTVVIDAEGSYFDRIPRVYLNHDPYIPDLSNFLFTKYNQIMSWSFTQKDIQNRILSDTKVDTIILILVDGLSFDDCKNRPFVTPCLVNGATITPVGFRNIIGKPPIEYHLFKRGFKSRIGFSYWDRSNELTNLIFTGFDPGAQMHRVEEFDQILSTLSGYKLNKTYVQIILSGLDQFAHEFRDRPPVNEWVERLFSHYIESIKEILQAKGLIGHIYVVSDHGILWKPKRLEKKVIVIPEIQATRKRFMNGHKIRNNVIHVSCFGEDYSLLKYPYIYNDFRSNEWGTHGGISYYESIVPFLKLEVF